MTATWKQFFDAISEGGRKKDSMIDDKTLDEWERLCESATPEPWDANDPINQANRRVIAHDEFIAAARSALPALIQEVRRLRSEVDSLWSFVDTLSPYVGAENHDLHVALNYRWSRTLPEDDTTQPSTKD